MNCLISHRHKSLSNESARTMSDVQCDKERKSEAMRARTHSFQVNVKELQRESVIIIASLEPLSTA